MSFFHRPTVEEADVRDVAARPVDDGSVLVDVREPHEWRAGHVADARHIPLLELPAQLEELPRSAPIYLICRTGSRSGRAAAWLKEQGFERPINVHGGIVAWERAGLPISREP